MPLWFAKVGETLKIGVISDTHMPSRSLKLPQRLVDGLQGVDLILHAGDWIAEEVAVRLAEIAPVDGIAGNNDGEEIRNRFGRQKVLTLEGIRIGLIHGDGYHKSTPERAFEAFRELQVAMVIFGHSHIPYKRMHQDVLLFNPGSPTDKRFEKRYSYGLVTLGETITAEHYYYDDKS